MFFSLPQLGEEGTRSVTTFQNGGPDKVLLDHDSHHSGQPALHAPSKCLSFHTSICHIVSSINNFTTSRLDEENQAEASTW